VVPDLTFHRHNGTKASALHVGENAASADVFLTCITTFNLLYISVMVDEAGELFSQHDDSIGEVDLLGEGTGSPFTDDHTLDHDSNLESIFDDPLPSLNSPLRSPTRSTNSSVGSGDTITRNNSCTSLGLPGNELVETDWRNDDYDLRARKDILLQM